MSESKQVAQWFDPRRYVPRQWSRRGQVLSIGVAGVLLLTVGAALVNRSAGEVAAISDKSLTTAQVTRQTLVDRDTVSGTLEFGDSIQLFSRSSGTVTYTAQESSTLRRNAVLWRVNENPALLMYGNVPAYRTMQDGDSGADVRQLEENLKKLGYDGFTVDRDFSAATADAVAQWQDDVGLDDTGAVTLGQVIFTPGPVRVAGIDTDPGAMVQAGGHVLTVTSTKRVVSIDLATGDQSLAHKGAGVVVTLPDGVETTGTIAIIGTIATSEASSAGGAGEGGTTTSAEATIPVTVTLDTPATAHKWDSAPVDVDLESDRADNVLTVPVTALVALAEGGYAVEVSSGPATQLVAVTTGLFADGRVEVTGEGIADGTTVVVPSS